ncbi:MAG: hypothetical protein K2J76_07970, partial [Oscillospiraceae bacterium]|nr:hypothetical protein [Oscillospiraceae bacterium]
PLHCGIINIPLAEAYFFAPPRGEKCSAERLENTALRLLLRVSLSMPKREAQGKYVPCENASGAEIVPQGKSVRTADGGNVLTENVMRTVHA